MNPQIVHRHTFPVRDVIELLLEVNPEAERWQMRVEADELVIDIVGPTEAKTATEVRTEARQGPGDHTVVQPPPIAPAAAPASEEPELKGGRLARDASMQCQDKTFRLWIDAEDADAARAIVLKHCGVESRRLLDHDDAAAQKWREIDRLYAAWLDGDDAAQMPQLEKASL